jgi:cell wall-associated NlpC family hydrolase
LFIACATSNSGISSEQLSEQGLLVTREAATYLRTPYRSPPNAPFTFDCSAFVSYVYARFGYKLPTSTSAYGGVGTKIDWEDAVPGDILVFANVKGSKTVDHVAILWEKSGNGQLAGSRIIHAASINTGASLLRGNPDTRTGVVITQLGLRGDGVVDNEYFYQRFMYCTRVLK